MALYGIPYYGGFQYGSAPKLAYSVEPMTITVVNFSTVSLAWQTPTGTFTRIRLVRSQSGIPETPEDGLILWDEYATQGTVSRQYFVDGVDNPVGQPPLVSGKEVFYSIFIFTSGNVWVQAGVVAAIIPSNHGSHDTLVNAIPRVFTSKEQTPLGEPDATSPLVQFLDGISFTLDEFQTYLDLLRGKFINMPLPLIPSGFAFMGLLAEPNIPTVLQKRLVREATYMYSRKGTLVGLTDYCESLTGFAPTVTLAKNIMLTRQDSTFYQGLGNWTATNGTLALSTTMVPNTAITTSLDTVYTAAVTATAAGSMAVGADTPITKGVPVAASTQYTVSAQIKSPPSSGSMTISVTFYNGAGTALTTTSGTATAATNTWQSISVTATSDATAVYASVRIAWSAAGTYYVDMVSFQTGSTVSYDEARSFNITLAPKKTNWVKNPSFEVNGTSDWTLAGSATVTQSTDVPSALASTGTYSAQVVATGPWTYTSNTFPITIGAYYTASAYVKSTADLKISFVGRNSLGNITETKDITDIGIQANWTRASVTDLTDAIAHQNTVTYEVVFTGVAGTYNIDGVLAENSFFASDYFDGSLPAYFGAEWGGTANDSYSYLYPGQPYKIPRLAYTLNDWIPPNTFWTLSTLSGIQYNSTQV